VFWRGEVPQIDPSTGQVIPMTGRIDPTTGKLDPMPAIARDPFVHIEYESDHGGSCTITFEKSLGILNLKKIVKKNMAFQVFFPF
jgi:hypothetical protein